MAEDKSQKSEKPTPRHKKEARKDGRVARSAEIGSWFSLGVVAFLLPTLGRHAVSEVSGFMSIATTAMASDDPSQAVALLGRGLWTVLLAAGPILFAAVAAAALAGYGQVGVRSTPARWVQVEQGLSFDRDQADLLGQGGMGDHEDDLAPGDPRGIGYGVYRQLVQGLLGPGTLPIEATITTAGGGLLKLVRDIACAAFLLGMADYAFQRRQFNDSMKMTREEVRREMRETEGNPEIRRALRRRRRRLSRMQILAAVARADVVVVNPTHFSVGLRYERGLDGRPCGDQG